jgi:hypothetical protein
VAGRRKGVPNKATVEVKELSAQLLDDPEYRERLQKRLRSGDVAPAVECMLWYYRFGKPKERVEVDGSASLLDLLAAAGRAEA